MKSTIITILLALLSVGIEAKTFKTIKNPVAMACVNVSNGELKAREVIFRDTATTVHFTMEYLKGQNFQFVSSSYLMDEDGNRYPLRSAEGIALNTWVQSPSHCRSVHWCSTSSRATCQEHSSYWAYMTRKQS